MGKEETDGKRRKGSEPCLGSVIHCMTSSKTLKSIKRLFLGCTLGFITLTLQSCEDEVKLSVCMFKNIQCYPSASELFLFYSWDPLNYRYFFFYFGLFFTN